MVSFELRMESSDSDSVSPCLCENKEFQTRRSVVWKHPPWNYIFSLCCLRYLLFKSRCAENGQLETWKLFLIRSLVLGQPPLSGQ
jgi:hypothetical protein